MLYIEPGLPWEGGYIETFKGELKGQAAGRGGLLHVVGGEGAVRALQTDLQPNQAAHLGAQ